MCYLRLYKNVLPKIKMVYLTSKKIGNVYYWYLIKNIRLKNNNWKKISKYIGKDEFNLDKKKLYLEHANYFIEKELELKKELIQNNNLSFDKDVLPKIERDSIKIWNLIKITENEKQLIKMFAIEFIFESNAIEGSKIPREEVKKILEEKKSFYKDKNEVKEVENTIVALNFLKSGFSFSEQGIKKLYHIITKDLFHEGKAYEKGYKKIRNIVGTSETTDPKLVPFQIAQLIKWYKENKNKINPLKLAFEFHLRFEAIHPFLDGNGRVGRLIMNKILMINQYPPMIIYQSNRISYFNAIKKGREKGEKHYFTFMLKQYQKTIKKFYEKELTSFF